MSTPTFLIRIIAVLLVVIAIDFYCFKGFRLAVSGIGSARLEQFICQGYWVVSILFLVNIVIALLKFNRSSPPNRAYMAFLMGTFILLYVPKLILVAVMLVEDITRLLRAGGVGVGKMVSDSFAATPYFEGRRRFVSLIGLGLASIPFIGIIYGIAKGKYKFTLHKVTLKFKDLPESFDGFTITQLSDMHLGSFDDPEEVKKGILMANAQKSDVVLFTGDMVNNMAAEAEPWKEHLALLKAREGKFSVLGNHDYGDYMDWPSAEAKSANLERLKAIQAETGFKLLCNENIVLKRNGEFLHLIGMENWGNGSFAKYGNLAQSLTGVPSEGFKILMSHDPSHWEAQTLHHKEHIHLTLAGHTHGMQFGVEIPWLKWSPVKYRYPRWGGLYTENNKHLYVNRGFGFIGFPGRVGIWPEITVITLQRG